MRDHVVLFWRGRARRLDQSPYLGRLAALVFAYLDAGAKASMLHTEFTFELGTIIQAIILLLVTATFVFGRRKR